MLLAQEKAVRVLLLSLVQQLSLPEKPTVKQVQYAATAASTLRKRILREKERVQGRIAKMEDSMANQTRVRDVNDLDSDNENGDEGARRREYDLEAALREDKTRELTRHEFLFVTEMQGKGNHSIVVDQLCLHGMRHPDDLLPQLLKLLAVMTAPPERLCGDRHRVADAVEQLRKSCATDDFFSLLVQCVAPIAGKRRDGPLPRKDVAMLELILCIFNNMLTGPEAAVVPVVGAMCRSHGVELLLVVLHQNYERFIAIQQGEDEDTQDPPAIDAPKEPTQQAPGPEEIDRSDSPVETQEQPVEDKSSDMFPFDAAGTLLEIIDDDGAVIVPENDTVELLVPSSDDFIDASVVHDVGRKDTEVESTTDGGDPPEGSGKDSDGKSESTTSESEEHEEGEEEEGEDEEDDELQIADEAFKHDMALAELLQQEQEEIRGETYGNILNWNLLILNAMSLIFRCGVPSIDLSSWSPNSETANVFALVEKSAAQIRQQQREDCSWRSFARHRNGSASSNGLIIRKRADEKPPQVVLGSVTQLLSGQRRTPLERLIEADKKKRAKFSKKQLIPRGMTDVLPVPTLLHLTKQIATFLSSGFEALSQMVWQHVREQLVKLEEVTRELQGIQARPSFVDEGPMISDLSGIKVSDALRYCGTCAAMMRLTRDSLKQHRDAIAAGGTLSPDAQRLLEEHWRAASHVMTLEHIQRGFDILSSFLISRQLFAEEDVCTAMDYVSEMLLVLVALMAGEIVDDPSVTMPAHALGSSLLFNESNVRAVWGWVGHPRITTHKQLQSTTLLLHSLFALMERSSFNGAFSMPKRKGHGGKKPQDAAANFVDTAVDDEKRDNRDEAEETAGGTMQMVDDDIANFIDDDADEDALRRKRRMEKNDKAAEADGATPLPSALATDAAGSLFDDEVDERLYNAMLEGRQNEVVEIEETEEPLLQERAGSRPQASLPQPRRSESRGSEHHSMASSGHVSLSSEREAHVDDFYLRLSQPKNAQMLLRTFQTWRLNENEANSALESLLDRLQKHMTARSVLFTVHFLSVVNDVLHHGKESHPILFEICDRIAFDFFNPPRNNISPDPAVAASMWRTDLAFRCARSLFFLPPASYFALDGAGHVQPAPPPRNDETEVVVDADGYVTSAGPKKPRGKRARRVVENATAGGDAAEGNEELIEQLFQEALEKERRKKHHRDVEHDDNEEEREAKRRRRERSKDKRKDKKHKKHKKHHRRQHDNEEAGADQGETEEGAAQTFLNADGKLCIVADDGLVYQIEGDAENGYYYIYQPGTTASHQEQEGSAHVIGTEAAGEEAAAADEYRRQQDDEIRKIQEAQTIAEPHHIDPPQTLDFLTPLLAEGSSRT